MLFFLSILLFSHFGYYFNKCLLKSQEGTCALQSLIAGDATQRYIIPRYFRTLTIWRKLHISSCRRCLFVHGCKCHGTCHCRIRRRPLIILRLLRFMSSQLRLLSAPFQHFNSPPITTRPLRLHTSQYRATSCSAPAIRVLFLSASLYVSKRGAY